MPRSHYPAQGGPHLPAWNPAYARLPHRAALFAPPLQPGDPAANAPGTAQDARLLPSAHSPSRPSASPLPSVPAPAGFPPVGARSGGAASQAARNAPVQNPGEELDERHYMVWIAAFLCAAATLFAYLAICRHG